MRRRNRIPPASAGRYSTIRAQWCRVGGPIRPGWRNEFHAGFQQAFGKYVVVDGEYIWKYTHGAYDFGVVAASPLAFPIEWHNSKIPGYTLRVSVPNYHGFSALVVMSSVAARFFPPQSSGHSVPAGAGGIPYRPRREIQPNDTLPVSAVEERSLGRLQLAV
jgi:hypothetical protein